MQRVQQEASSPTLVPDEAQAIQQCSLEDVEQYDGYVRVVERFLRRWDPAAAAVAAAQPSVSVALANTPVLLPPTASAAALGEANGHPPDATVVIELAEEPRWESMAPALADQLASAAANSKTSWAQVVSLFTGVKGFREAERAELWNYWAQLRNESALLASKVVRMQQRREALVQLKSLLFPLSGTSMEAMQSEWEERLVQRMQEMRETYVKYQHQPQKQY
ncbi:hypothetical protein DQ04_00011450 [Trypanosoma grayi]|uniref:hypothetical protein n=1 Tax=Trypanosoma grayi TaxID=71804 RepID=UPI0004F440D9|nr:hypothetical protein DQ04_00011450 [Trypanosoma grayi]KEG15678.1 hypothetical protein DQ04_00011450 [Trypanosoma grayi]